MKFLIVAIAIFTFVNADVSELKGYNYDHEIEEIPVEIQESVQYLPPASKETLVADAIEQNQQQEGEREQQAAQAQLNAQEPAIIELANDVESEPSQDYLPPQEVVAVAEEIAVQQEPEPEPAHVLADDGYQYRTIKRFRYRYRI